MRATTVDFTQIHSMGFRILMIRDLLNMGRPEFAALINMPPTTLKNYELGYRECDLETVQRMLWHRDLHELAMAMFVNTPIVELYEDKYRFIGSPDVQIMDRPTLALKLRSTILDAAKLRSIPPSFGYELRWTDNGR